ncbi:MAG: response regulator [Bacteroidales bacterium]|jgi:CheY-like chemotaxis protein/signal transduction histidine kinase|nr:response regulator [Bacteroidales bacterium]
MIKSFKNEKDRNKTWVQKSREAFMNMLLIFGGGLFLLSGSYFLFLKTDVFAGALLYGFGALSAIIYIVSRKKGYYPLFVFPLYTGLYAALVFTFLLAGGDARFEYGLALGMLFSLIAVSFFETRNGIATALCFVIACLVACGMTDHFTGENMALVVFACLFSLAALFRIAVCQQLNRETIVETDSRMSDIQQEAQQKNEYLSQLSHEVRTPLNNIVVVGNLLNETDLNLRQKDWLETILASANNLVNVMNMIASKVTSKTIVDTKTANVAFNLQDLLKNTVQLFVGQSEDYNIALKPNLRDTESDFEGDSIRIKQVFLTLIESIIKNKKSEKINIILSYKIKQETDRVFNVTFNVRVSDLPDLTHLDSALNYSISSHLVESIGGKLTETQGENFTDFEFTLSFNRAKPAHQEKKPLPETSAETAKPAVAADDATLDHQPAGAVSVDLKDANILLVEDNLINQKIVILSIQKLVKNIDIANNGQEALDKYTKAKYDIILMDIQMPIMDGLQATKKIREIEADTTLGSTPIIAITANALAGDREHCLASGMDEYISKPFQVEVLVSKMKTLLSAGSSA